MSALRRRHRGFTLLEVLVAFVILAGSVAVLSQVFEAGLRTAVDAGDRARAVELAQSVLAEAANPGPGLVLRPGESSGDFGDRFRWAVSIRPYGDAAAPGAGAAPRSPVPGLGAAPVAPVLPGEWGLMEIDCRVTWSRLGVEREYRLSTLRISRRSP